MTIKVNGEVVNVEENDELEVTADTAIVEAKEVEVLEAKETISSKIRNMPLWKKTIAAVSAVAGGAYIASKLGGHDDEDEEDDDESEDVEMEE